MKYFYDIIRTMLKIPIFYISFLNFASISTYNDPYLKLSSFHNNFFSEISNESSNNKKQQLIKLLNLQKKFKPLNFFIKSIIGCTLSVATIYFLINKKITENIHEKELDNYKHYIAIYMIINNILFTIYMNYKHEDFLYGNLFEKIIFIVSFLGLYFAIKEFLYKILVEKIENYKNLQEFFQNMENHTYKGDLLQISSFILICHLYVEKLKYLKELQLKNFRKILKKNQVLINGKYFYYNNAKTRKILSIISV